MGWVDGQGTTTEAHTYRYTVPDLGPGLHQFRLKQIDFDGSFSYSDEVEVTVEIAGTHRLSDAYPNPFNPQTVFELTVAEDQPVRVEVLDVLGRRVAVLHDGGLQAHRPQRFTFEASGLPNGLYFYRATGETFAETGRMVLMK